LNPLGWELAQDGLEVKVALLVVSEFEIQGDYLSVVAPRFQAGSMAD
jgi:hypothetical protein